MEHISRDEAFALLKKYNKDPFHIQHALTVEAVMKWYANELGYSEDAEYWGIVGLLHDIDFELYPEEHCIKAPELLREGGVSEDIIHGVVSHGYGITVDIAPEHEMEKVLFAADELTGLIWAAALMRPSKSTKDMELKSLKKKCLAILDIFFLNRFNRKKMFRFNFYKSCSDNYKLACFFNINRINILHIFKILLSYVSKFNCQYVHFGIFD